MLNLLLLLSIGASSVDANDLIWKAPQLAPLAADLGLAVDIPENQPLFADHGTCFPLVAANAVKMRLAECQMIPLRCQSKLDAAKILSEPPQSFPWWMMATIAFSSFVLGSIAGIVVSQ